MRRLIAFSKSVYGAHPLHLLVLLASLALGAYAVYTLGLRQLFNPNVWWQSIIVWFAVAIIGHDLILFPLYTLADRLVPTPTRGHRIPATNYLRIPTLAAGLLLLLFFPGIIEQGATTYHNATGLTQQPFLSRWLVITAVLYALSALAYAIASFIASKRRRGRGRSREQPHATTWARHRGRRRPVQPRTKRFRAMTSARRWRAGTRNLAWAARRRMQRAFRPR